MKRVHKKNNNITNLGLNIKSIHIFTHLIAFVSDVMVRVYNNQELGDEALCLLLSSRL